MRIEPQRRPVIHGRAEQQDAEVGRDVPGVEERAGDDQDGDVGGLDLARPDREAGGERRRRRARRTTTRRSSRNHAPQFPHEGFGPGDGRRFVQMVVRLGSAGPTGCVATSGTSEEIGEEGGPSGHRPRRRHVGQHHRRSRAGPCAALKRRAAPCSVRRERRLRRSRPGDRRGAGLPGRQLPGAVGARAVDDQLA